MWVTLWSGAGVDVAISASNGVTDSTITLTEISGAGWGLGWSAGGTDQLRLPDTACLTLTPGRARVADDLDTAHVGRHRQL